MRILLKSIEHNIPLPATFRFGAIALAQQVGMWLASLNQIALSGNLNISAKRKSTFEEEYK